MTFASLEDMAAFGDALVEKLGGKALRCAVVKGELILWARRSDLVAVMEFLKTDANCKFSQLIDICGVDYPDQHERFEVVYQLLSMSLNNRIRVKVTTDENTAVPSVSRVFSAAGWFERETWDMYGVMFDALEDHRRILTDYGFDGHPLRKDFPLTGHVEVRYDQDQKRVVYGPVTLTQDFRSFDYLSPWEGMTNVQLPGDEKAAQPKTGWNPVSKATE